MENLKWINGRGEYIIQPKVTAETAHTMEGEAHAVSYEKWLAFDGIIDQNNKVTIVSKFYNKLQSERDLWKPVFVEHNRIAREFARDNKISVLELERLINTYWSNRI